ncbi:hypothetical protein [Escherichia coli]|nr:hypothetical protein [Escherichia coli]AZA00753.1 hypothetical protein EGM66_08230 [Escherichia coli]KSX52045.1 hypothetical protein APT88_07085 [Escherichia coli]
MGGYGALLCAAKLKSRAVVTAPQTTLNAKNAKIPQSWMKDINQYPVIRDNLASELISVESIKIIYDVKDRWDVSHVNYLKSHIKWIDEYTIPYATHNLPRTLREMGIISSVISSAFKGKNNKNDFRKLINKNKKKSISYISNLGHFVENSKNKWLYSYYKRIVAFYFDDLMSSIKRDSWVLQNNTLDAFNNRLIYINNHVEVFDTNKLIFLSRGNDPQLELGCLPDGNLECNFSFFSNVASFGNVFFSRDSNTAFTPKDAISFSVSPGITHVTFILPGSSEDRLRKIRIDPISCPGFFQVLDFRFV